MARRLQLRALATALVVCCALATTAAALRDDEAADTPAAAPKLPARRLLQPFDLGLPAATRRSGNVGNTREGRINANNFNIAGGVDTSPRINNTIRARTVTLGETTNMNFGGAGKTTYTVNAATTNSTSETETGVDVRSIGAVGPGITASRAVDSSSSLASKRTKPAGPLRNATDLNRFQGPTDNVPAGAWKVLGAGASDYAFAGDYDYSIITSIIDNRGTDRQFVGDADIYDYDYGQPRLIPETSAVTTRTASRLNNEAGRAAGFGGNSQTVSAPNGVARGAVITSGIVGNNAARLNDDLFGTAPVFIPPNQVRSAGASVSGVGITRTYKGSQRPGFATNAMNAGTTVSRNYITGGAATQRNYAQANQAVSVRSQNVALSGEENIDLDVGKRRLLRANHHTRRLHRATAAAGGQH